ncbi:MAG: response regulator [Candidatus Aenigmarchaeota archaeon]|nr:response regulator [Candidatus Aenigmarchaeota archaeon]
MYEKIRTLIVDDDSNWRYDLQDIAQKAGLKKIDVVSSEREAVALLDKGSYHLMMLDTKYGSLVMGPNIAKAAIARGHSPRIVALSGSSDNEKLWQNHGFEYKFIDKSTIGEDDIKPILNEIEV